MSIRKEPSGRRSIQVEVEVPGTPEEVWQAIATGPGISSWFVPTEFEAGPDGAPKRVVHHFGPGMDSVADITAWEPLRRFSAESEGLGPGAPAMGTEWIVEARDGGVCVVRVVHSLFTSADDWDGQLEGMETGWPAFFIVLKTYLSHFKGQESHSFSPVAIAPVAESNPWRRLVQTLGLETAVPGQSWKSPATAPSLSGSIRMARQQDDHPHMVVQLESPTPGVVLLTACPMGDQCMLSLCFYLYGKPAAGVVAREEPLWQNWLKETFPVMVS